jgi:DNA helicase HerA-like ATPase
VGAIQRGLLALEDQGGDLLFGEPSISLADLLRADGERGVVNILDARKLFHSPKLYATFLLWLLSELFEQLPEVGDPDKPKLVFFFDEAHLLFDDAPKALVEKVEQVVRLIRSKGVGLYFVSQNPIDIPDEVLGQLGHRVQHALRAFTPKDQQAIEKSAQTFRQNPNVDIPKEITELGVGEALVSFLQEDGSPGVVQRALIRPPHSQIGPVTDDQRKFLIQSSPMAGRYEAVADRESAHEMLLAKAEAAAAEAEAAEASAAAAKQAKKPAKKMRSREGIVEAVTKSTLRSVGSQMGRSITRGILGSIFRKR